MRVMARLGFLRPAHLVDLFLEFIDSIHKPHSLFLSLSLPCFPSTYPFPKVRAEMIISPAFAPAQLKVSKSKLITLPWLASGFTHSAATAARPVTRYGGILKLYLNSLLAFTLLRIFKDYSKGILCWHPRGRRRWLGSVSFFLVPHIVNSHWNNTM